MVDYLDICDAEWKWEHKGASFFQTHIFTIRDVQEHLDASSKNPALTPDQRKAYTLALDLLNTTRLSAPFPVASADVGGRHIFIKRIAIVFIDDEGNYTGDHTSDTYWKEMLRLAQLHNREAVYHKHVVSVTTAYCAFCKYHCEHHQAINNHISCHWHLGLMCGVPGCHQVFVECGAMWVMPNFTALCLRVDVSPIRLTP